MGTGASATVAQSAIQSRIDAQQTLDAIEYGIRSVELCGHAYGCSVCHTAQIVAGCQAATRVLGRLVAQDNGTLRLLKAARKQQREVVKAIAADVRAIGTARQIRMAMAA